MGASLLALLLVAATTGCSESSSRQNPDTGAPRDSAIDAPASDGPARDAPPADAPPSGPGWRVAYHETFDNNPALPNLSWRTDEIPDDGPFSDNGKFFTDQNINAPAAYRATATFGKDGWLTVEAYSRSNSTDLAQMLSISADPDPAASTNRVLKLSTAAHQDGIVVRPSTALPTRYRISLRVGYADFGDGKAGNNGYDGGERAEPWHDKPATSDNGYYWLAILDAPPRPHNNVWIHHHRKVVVDTDNHYPPSWMSIFNGQSFEVSGEHPVMIFALDGLSDPYAWTGHDFIAWADGGWQPSGEVRAADRYKPDRWYEVTIERKDAVFTVTVSGDFQHGGQQRYGGTIDAAARCVYHYNQSAAAQDQRCVNTDTFSELPGRPHWPQGSAYPDYFMFGDPHNNFYEGTVYYDDVKLETWSDG